MSTESGRRGMARWALRAAAAAIAFTAIVPPRAAGEQRPLTILTTGADVPGFGRIGETDMRLLGLDDTGAALVDAGLSDGTYGLFRVDGERVVPLWLTSNQPDALPFPLRSSEPRISRSGHILALGNEPTGDAALYTVIGGTLRRVARVGDVDASGHVLCSFHLAAPELAINDNGTVAFAAWTDDACERYAESGYDFDEVARLKVLYRASASGLQRVAANGDPSPFGRPMRLPHLIGVAGDDAVLFVDLPAVYDPAGVLAARGGEIAIVADARPLRALVWRTRGVSDNGNVLLYAGSCGSTGMNFRTEGDVLVGVALETPDISFTDDARINDAGDVLLHGGPLGGLNRSLVLYPAGSPEPRVVIDDRQAPLTPGSISNPMLNNAGDIAFMSSTAGSPTRVMHWSAGVLEELLNAGDPAPGGAVFATYGLGDQSACLAPDGSVAVLAASVIGSQGIVCADDRGTMAVVQRNDLAPDGNVFEQFNSCEFVGRDNLLFSAALSDGTSGLFRAGPHGVEKVASTDDVTIDGAPFAWGGYQWGAYTADPSGGVLVLGNANERPTLVISNRNGLRRVVALMDEISPDLRVRGIESFDIGSDGTVVFSAHLEGSMEHGVFAWHDGTMRPLVLPGDARLPVPGIYHLRVADVRDRRVLLVGFDGPTDRVHIFVADLDSGALQHVKTFEDPADPRLMADGRVALGAYVDGDWSSSSPPFTLFDTAGGEEIIFDDLPPGLEGVALNKNGQLLLRSSGASSSAGRQELLLAGAQGSRTSCPRFAAAGSEPAVGESAASVSASDETPWWRQPDLSDWVGGCSGGGPIDVEIPAMQGPPGGQVEMQVVLRALEQQVAGVQMDIGFAAPLRIATRSGGGADCSVNPAINKSGTVFALQPDYGGDPRRLRALVLALDNVDPIADGSLLFTCRVDIAPDAQPGRHRLTFTELGGSTPDGEALETSALGGEVEVVVPQDNRATSVESGGGSGGCHIATGATRDSVMMHLLVGVLIVLLGRRLKPL